MDLTFWGAARTVTGSQHLLSFAHQQLLLDCGLFQGRRADTYLINQHLPFDARGVSAILLSHAHIDHSGNIPSLVKAGFAGTVYCTHATRDLCSAMLRASGMIQEEDARFLNKHRRNGEPPVQPIYTADDAEAALKHFGSYNYDQPFRPIPGIQVTFGDAGHMLGSAWVLIEITEDSRTVRVCFS